MLEGKVTIITGGGSGIGEAAAKLFAQQGAKVIVSDLDEAEAQRVAQAVTASGGQAVALRADVAQEADVLALVQCAIDQFGRLDAAFNNAGAGVGNMPTEEFSSEQWLRALDVNLTGVWLCMKHQIRQFKAQGGGGSIVNTASAFGLLGSKGGSAYSASKHGVVGLTASAALDEAEHQIRINAVCPGVIRTPMAERYAKQLDDPNKPLARTPLKRWGEPSEIAEAALWLLSDRASFVTGVAMPVDGGMLAG